MERKSSFFAFSLVLARSHVGARSIKVHIYLNPADLQIPLYNKMNDMEVVWKLLKVLTCNGSRTIDNFVRSLSGPSKPIR